MYEQIELEKIETGTILKILPSVGENGYITMELGAEVSNVIARGQDGLPVVTRRSAQSTVRIEDGGTMAIAGLMDSRNRQRDEATPGISDIPVAGELFKNTTGLDQRKQVAVFITAHILPEPGEARKAEQPKEHRSLPPVSKGEFVPQLIQALKGTNP